jgi:hypothetical protein
MATGPQMPEVPPVPTRRGARAAAGPAAWCVALLAGSLLLGLAGGVIWNECAPRVLLQEVSAGTAEVVNVETRAFFGADVWFAGIAVVAGLLTGLLGYRFAVAPRTGSARVALVAALIVGALGGGLVMMWLGGRIGLSAYDHQLAASRAGTLFSASLALRAKSALALWPLLTSGVLLIAEWSGRPAPADEPAGQPF